MKLRTAVRLGGMGWLLAAWCASAAITVEPWAPMFRGVDFARGEADTNEVRQQKVFALRVDLSDPTVEFFSTPSNGDGPLETFGQTTTTFVESYGVSVGVNANFFSPVSTIPDDPRELNGLAVSQGNVVSPFEGGRPAVLISRSNGVSFATSAPSSLTNVWTAVAGSDRILINGVAQLEGCTTSFCNENPRTAVGLSQEGRYFYLMVIDGRRPGWSDGATLYETGQWLLRLGAWNGLNLDGGGSSAMAWLTNGTAVLLNQPSGSVQRVNGNHLGVFAQPLGAGSLVGRLFGAQKSGDVFSVLLQTDTVGQYSLEYTDSLLGSDWTALPAVSGNGAVLQLTDPHATNAHRFYRVRRW